MARPVKKTPDEWRKEILNAAQELFISKGYEETSISDIMEMAGGAKGMFYRCFGSKEEVMHTLGNQMFFENNPFDAIKERKDLNGLQKIKSLLVLNQSDAERNQLNRQAIPILKDPHILAAAIEENRRVLTPLWLELLEEGGKKTALSRQNMQKNFPSFYRLLISGSCRRYFLQQRSGLSAMGFFKNMEKEQQEVSA